MLTVPSPFPGTLLSTLCHKVIPAVFHADRDTQTAGGQGLLKSENMSIKDVSHVFQAFTKEMNAGRTIPQSQFLRVRSFLHSLCFYKTDLTISELGTGWRLATLILGEQWTAWWNESDQQNSSHPYPLQAAGTLAGIEPVEDDLLRLIVDAHPDLADLPAELALQVAATMPLPDEWFVDVVDLPAVEWVAPGLTYADWKDGHYGRA